jgi:UDP-N-acetylglucosamine:LPS N-acetylglucosamine transferase
MSRERRILAIASGGGHWTQLRRLSPAFNDLNVSYVSVFAGNRDDVPDHRYYNVRDVSRRDRWGFAVLIVQCLGILVKERPHVVVTTGSAPGFVMLALAKTFFGARTLWIDSIANFEQLSMSGRQAGKFADIWLTQWPHLRRGQKPDYWGAVL